MSIFRSFWRFMIWSFLEKIMADWVSEDQSANESGNLIHLVFVTFLMGFDSYWVLYILNPNLGYLSISYSAGTTI
jgi:hypothetical protein